MKRLIKRCLRAAGLSVVRIKHAHFEAQVISNLLKASGVTVILDVGANAGQFGDLVFFAGFKGRLISFEAIPDVHRKLAEHASLKSGCWTVAPCAAIGSSRGQIEFNIAENSVSSSILPMNRHHLDAAPQSRYIEKKIVPMERLDEIATPYIPSSASLMIKVDTQGYEMEVLKGSTKLLPRTAALQLEMSLTPLYDGAPTLIDVVSYAASIGFKLFSIVPSFWDTGTGQLLQADGFFIRSDV